MSLRNPPDGQGMGAAKRRPSLPCLNSNNSVLPTLDGLKSNHRKTAFCLEFNIRRMAQKYELKNLGFLTLTFPQHVDRKEMQRRWNNLSSNVLRKRYRDYIAVVERGGKSGRLHFHFVIALQEDIRSGFKFEDIARGDYSSASAALRREWAFLRKVLPRYGFGRHELLPVRSTDEGIAKYVGKYVAKHIGCRVPEDKGLRLVRYSKGARSASNRFMWATEGARQWRKGVGEIARECGFTDLAQFTEHFGRAWAWAVSGYLRSEETALEHHTPLAEPGSVRRSWLPLEHSPIPSDRSGSSPREIWRRRIQASTELALRKRFRRFGSTGVMSKLHIVLDQAKRE